MGIRKVKDAIDLETKENIYFKGHAQATFMSDGRTVEEAINSSESSIDTEMSDVSTNAVQNRVIKGYVDSVLGNINTIIDNINGEEI